VRAHKLILVSLLGFVSANVGADEINHAREYDACMALARSDPPAAYESGLAWVALGGDLPARHCVAVALIGLSQYAEAASRLEVLASQTPSNRTDLKFGMLVQAGQAWTLAGKPDQADTVQTHALALSPSDADLLVDRAVSRISLGRHAQAINDLSRALSVSRSHVEAMVYRATANRFLGRTALARRDLESALSRAPDHPGALLERGLLKRLAGDRDGARRDWLAVIENAPSSPEADAARNRLAEMDVKSD
jgi:tetratricopeptide (TPR) repeat protein